MLQEHLDGRLDASDQDLLEAHVAVCEACQAIERDLRSLHAAFGRADTAAPPPGFHALVMARVRRREQARRAVVGGVTLSLGVVALLMLLAVPLLTGLIDCQRIMPALLIGGPETVRRLTSFWGLMVRTSVALLTQLAAPLATLGAFSLIVAILANCLLYRTLRRVYSTR